MQPVLPPSNATPLESVVREPWPHPFLRVIDHSLKETTCLRVATMSLHGGAVGWQICYQLLSKASHHLRAGRDALCDRLGSLEPGDARGAIRRAALNRGSCAWNGPGREGSC